VRGGTVLVGWEYERTTAARLGRSLQVGSRSSGALDYDDALD
jgi:hypothetical protein